MITVLCPNCRAAQHAPPGSQVQCFACRTVFLAPQPPPIPQATSTPPAVTPPPHPVRPVAGHTDQSSASDETDLDGETFLRGPAAFPWQLTLIVTILLVVFVGTATVYLQGKRIAIPNTDEKVAPKPMPIEPKPPPTPPVRWSDASRFSQLVNEVKVRITGVYRGEIRGKDAAGKVTMSESMNHWVLDLEIRNVGGGNVHYRSWFGRALADRGKVHMAQLTDQKGTTYDMLPFAEGDDIQGHIDEDHLGPREETRDRLIFVVPEEMSTSSIEYLRLELPAAAYGGEGLYHFQIPRTMIEGL